MKKIPFFYFPLVLALCGCSLPLFKDMELETVSVQLPAVPDAAAGCSGGERFLYRLSWIDGEGKPVSAETENRSFNLVLEKNRLTPILAELVRFDGKEGFSFFYPAGCLYPVHLSPGKELFLKWNLGTEAAIVRRLLLGSGDFRAAREYLEHFNWQKLESYLARYDNPWTVNTTLIAESIGSGGFTARNIKSLSLNTIRISPPGENPVLYDRYVPASPLRPDAEDTSTFTVHVPDGISLFLAPGGILTLSVTGKNTQNMHFARFSP
ncbi:MAG: hypothetical protein LBR47_07420 [Spirochaetaceae bacterium]|jgi:hypothetical protein|nr:hypothetical protein [Spirochaetaceae bacterium]